MVQTPEDNLDVHFLSPGGLHEFQRQPGLATLPIEVLQIIARKTNLES